MTALGVLITAILVPVLVARELARIGAVHPTESRSRRLTALSMWLLIAFVLVAAVRLWQLS